MIDDLRILNYAPETIKRYVEEVARFAKHFGKSPEVLGPEHIRQYQVFLVKNKVSWAIFNQAVCGLKFLYQSTLNKPWVVKHIRFPKMPKKLPVILSTAEVSRLINAPENTKHCAWKTSIASAWSSTSGTAREPKSAW
jgi:site-specific recombinase XerD